MKRILILALFALAVPACRNEEQAQPQERRWLKVYFEGEFEDSVDITGWEVGEDVVCLRAFYYPWQGEDSINYDNYFDYWEWGPGSHRCWFVLNVNGKLVGIDPVPISPSKIEHPGNVLTLLEGHYSIMDFLDSFPNLVGIKISVTKKTVDELSTYPSNIRWYVSCFNITNADLRRLSRHSNIRALEIEKCNNWGGGRRHNPAVGGFRALRRMKELRVLKVHGLFEDSEPIERYLKCLPKLRKTKVWIYDTLD